MKTSYLLRFLFISLICFAMPAFSQSNVNEEQGLKPYDSLHGGDLDSVSLTNGGLVLHIPLASFPQRGDLDLSFMVRFSSKQWVWTPPANNQQTGHWGPAPNSGTQIVSSVDWWMQTSSKVDIDGGYDWTRSVSSPDGNTHQLGGKIGSVTEGAVYPLRSLDATGLLHPDVHTLLLPNGTRYTYPFMSESLRTGGAQGYVQGVQPGTITDANGNQININTAGSAIGWTDTMGRYIPGSLSATSSNLVQPGVPTANLANCPNGTVSAVEWDVPGYGALNGGVRNLKFCYSNYTIAPVFDGTTVYGPVTWSLLNSVVLPDLTKWTFSYDSYGDVTQVGFPTGGSISYSYVEGPSVCTSATHKSMVVAARTVNANDGTGGHTWNYSYNLNSSGGTVTVTSPPDATSPTGNDAVHTVANPLNATDGCSLYEKQADYYQGSASGRTLLKTVTTQYSGNLANSDFNGSALDFNVVPHQVTTVWPGGTTNKTVSTYDASTTNADGEPVIVGSVLQKDEYDFSNNLVRSTFNTFVWQDSSKAVYKTNNFVSLLESTTVKDAGGNQIAQTTYGYDETAAGSSGVTTQLTTPPAGGNVRGNTTTVGHWLNSPNSIISSTATYLDSGMKDSSTDPLGRTTTYIYGSSFYGAYLTQTNMPDTQMPDPGAPVVHHVISGGYDFNTGLLTSFSDENGQSFTYNYDIMLRLVEGDHPDGGKTIFSYPDANTVTRQRLITSGTSNYDSYTVTFDGLGRPKQTQHATPSGTVYADTIYDQIGRIWKVSNPYYVTTEPTYGITETQYDGLGRTLKTIKPDSSFSTALYSDNCTTGTDEAGKQRKACNDGLGRLTEVDEPNPGAQATVATGTVTISGTEQSNSQSGAPGTGTVTITGQERLACVKTNPNCRLPVWDSGSIGITVNGYTESVSYGQSTNTTAAAVASALACAFHNDPSAPVDAVCPPSSSAPNVVALTARTVGVSTDYSLSASNNFTTLPSAYMVSTSGANLTGGQDASSTPDTGTVKITINGTDYTATYAGSDTTSTIAQSLATAITAGSLANATAVGATVNITSKTAGAAVNYSLATSYTYDTVHFTHPSFTTSSSGGTLTGGKDASALTNNPYVTLYNYDLLNNLTCAEQHGAVTGTGCSSSAGNDATSPWRVRRFTYDSLSRLLTSKNPESGQISYAYDAGGNLISKTEPAPNQLPPSTATVTVTYAYDALNRLTGKTYSDSTQSPSYRYDYSSYLGQTFQYPVGRLVAATALNAAIADFTSYDPMGRVASTVQCIPGVATCQTSSASYDQLGDLITLGYPGSSFTVTYGYDAAARLISAVDSNTNTYGSVLSSGILASGAVQEFTSPNFNNFKYHTDYNNRLQPTEIWVGAAHGTSAIFDKQYTYNPPSMSQMNNGNIYTVTNVKDSTRTQSFTYDPLNRLTTAQDQTHWSNAYTYDAWGNLQKKLYGTIASGEHLDTTATVQNQLVGYTYDIAGNVVNDGAHTYTYDAENRIISVDGGTTYTYSANGQRINKSSGTNYWSGPGGMTLAESDAGGIFTDYVFFGGQRLARNIGGDIKYFVTDHLHSTAVFADKSGAVLDDNDFYPWGGVIQGIGQTTSTNHYKFTGKERDTESNLDYFGARYYSNAIGRFMSPDWAGRPTNIPYAELDDPQSLNVYSYVRNSPIMRIDADGHQFVNEAFQDWDFGILGAGQGNQGQGTKSQPKSAPPQPVLPTPAMLADPTQDENGVCYVEGKSPADKAKAAYVNHELRMQRTIGDGIDESAGFIAGAAAGEVVAPVVESLVGRIAAFWVGETSTQAAAEVADHVVLGLETFGLKETAANLGGRTLMGDSNWMQTFTDLLANPNTRFTVNLDGVTGTSTYDKFMNAAQSGISNGPNAGPFNWEMGLIYQAGRQGSLVFVEGGQAVSNPF